MITLRDVKEKNINSFCVRLGLNHEISLGTGDKRLVFNWKGILHGRSYFKQTQTL